jgi:hypothetical protein
MAEDDDVIIGELPPDGPAVPATVDTADATELDTVLPDVAIEQVTEGVQAEIDGISFQRMAEIFEYEDAETGFKTANIKVEKIPDDDIPDRFFEVTYLPQFKKCAVASMDIVNADGQTVGKHAVRFLFCANGDLYVEPDIARMYETDTGFGTRAQNISEDRDRNLGVKALIRGCGWEVGRYEGAKNGYDFALENVREEFIKVFCEFLEEKGISEVTYRGARVKVSELAPLLHTPQDILAVEGGKVTAILIRKWVDDQGKHVAEEEKLYPVGKAFFLDQGSKAKQVLPDGLYHGKWIGIKRLQ